MRIRKFLPIIMVAALLALALAVPATVVAASATRTLPAVSVAAGANFNVSIVASGCGSFGQVAETLPAGFSYVDTTSTDVSVAEVGNTVKFTFMGDSVSFTYTVTASTTAGTYSVSGVVKDDDTTEFTVGGDTSITVGAGAATSATRTLPASSVAAGANFNVSIVASGCGSFGQVAETLPAGFSYVDTTSTDVSVAEVGNTVKFTFMGDSVSFTYTVTASTTEGTYSVSGVVKDDDTTEFTVGGDTSITVGAGAATSATRTLPASSVAAGANFNVSIVASGCGSFGQVAETLPAGFSYVSTTSTDVSVAEVGNTVKFTFMGDSVSFTYTVTASTTAGTYSFSGVVKDDDTTEFTVGGNTAVTVGGDGTYYNLTISVSPAGTGTTNPAAGTHSYADGTVVALTATAASGYDFNYWSGAASGTSSTTSVTMNANKSVTANFVVETTPPPAETFAWWIYETFIGPYM